MLEGSLKNIELWKLKGLKIATLGLLVVILGFVLFLIDFELIGRLSIYCGFVIAFIGGVVHLVVMSKIFKKNK